MLAVLIPPLVRPETDVWVAAGAAGFCVGACQGLLLLVGRARKAQALRAASEAICARLTPAGRRRLTRAILALKREYERQERAADAPTIDGRGPSVPPSGS